MDHWGLRNLSEELFNTLGRQRGDSMVWGRRGKKGVSSLLPSEDASRFTKRACSWDRWVPSKGQGRVQGRGCGFLGLKSAP